MTEITTLDDPSVTAPSGFWAGATRAGIKPSGKLDLGLLVSESPCVAVGTFTQNAFPAAPVLLSRDRLQGGQAQAIVFNAGNANACTGPEGLADAEAVAAAAAEVIHVPERLILAASTGIVGQRLPVDRIVGALPSVNPRADGGHEAAEAIMTTDTRPKEAAVSLVLGEREVRIGAMGKGVGMIHPNMATMLAFVTTDASLDVDYARLVLSRVVDRTFNMVTVDGDTSTNDSCFLLANGSSGAPLIATGSGLEHAFEAALEAVCTTIARAMAADGEGATKLIQVDVTGARSLEDARAAARAVVRSNLVKAAVYGQDPNWGRILVAAGNSGAAIAPERTDLWIGGVQVARGGRATSARREDAQAEMKGEEVQLRLDLGLGPFAARAWGCDLTEAYVVENSAYTT